ncbi:MAG: glycosyltransferase [Balneolaceae bacterium]|nr:glycosyltransferase [Balneolaceae bacterium]
MELIIIFSIIWLLFTSVILLRNLVDLKSMHSISAHTAETAPLVSICIPARNEEDVIEHCVTQALKQNYPNFEVLVLDDNSTDETTSILTELSKIISNLHHIKGKEKPHYWMGKPWACNQLGESAKGKYLLFIDADVWLEEDALPKMVQALTQYDCITVWPKQYVGTFWEQMIVPMIYYAVFTLLPARYTERKPRWMPVSVYHKFSGTFAAACGQFIAFSREAYQKTGGHHAVQQEVVEDVQLAKHVRKHGLRLKMYHGTGTVNCRMYTSHAGLWAGLRKNFFAGFNKNILLFVCMGLLHLLVFVAPFVIFILALVYQSYSLAIFSLIPLLLIFLQRLLLDIRFGWNPSVSLLHPVSVLWYQLLGVVCLTDYLRGKKASWKGREV